MSVNQYLIDSFKKLGKPQTEIIKDLKKSQPYVSALMNGKKEVGGTVAKQLHDLYGFDISSILTGTGSMLKDETIKPQNSDVKIVDDENEADIYVNKNDIKFFIYPDDTYKVEVDMMPFKAYASSDIDCYFDKEYRENEFNKAIFSADNVASGFYLGFKSQNESMNGGGIFDTPSNAELLCRELGRHLWKKLHDTDYGFVLMTKKAILHKDITNYNEKTGMFTLHSRNPDVDDFEEHINDVYRIFRVVKRTF